MEDPEGIVRSSAAMAIAEWESPEIVPALIDALEKVSGGIYGELSAILNDLTGQKIRENDPATARQRWSEWWATNKTKFRLPKRQ